MLRSGLSPSMAWWRSSISRCAGRCRATLPLWKESSMSLIAIDHVRKRFGALEVLKGVSLDVAAGEVVAVIGRSGSGKSTLLRCVNGLGTIDEGGITVDGTHVGAHDTDLRALRLKVGMSF